LVLEGHESLRKEIREARDESNQKHEHTVFLINALNKKIDAVATDLADHRADTEGHKKAYGSVTGKIRKHWFSVSSCGGICEIPDRIQDDGFALVTQFFPECKSRWSTTSRPLL